ncbi:hypothetical protein [Microbacterium sp. NPDC089695]|uniref:hypothetical protein n=1 Tax=Microbacterium sp. NPDC089695 TaxID=3364198 RepID=UPI003812FC54
MLIRILLLLNGSAMLCVAVASCGASWESSPVIHMTVDGWSLFTAALTVTLLASSCAVIAQKILRDRTAGRSHLLDKGREAARRVGFDEGYAAGVHFMRGNL